MQDVCLRSPRYSGLTGRVRFRYCIVQQELSLGKRRHLPAKEVGHGIPRRRRSKCRTEMKENMTLWCVAFEAGGQGGEGEAPDAAWSYYL